MLTFGFVNTTTMIIVLAVALIIFGPGKLPELGGALGKGIKEFKSASDGKDKKVEDADETKSETK